MRKFLVVLLSVVIFFSPIMITVNHAEAQAFLPHFENLKVLDPNNVDYTSIPLLVGGIYTVRFNVVIDVNQSDVQLALNTNLEKVGDTFWKLENNYRGIDTETWQPGKNEIVFNAYKGVASLTLTGRIPENFTIIKGDDPSYDLHLEKNMTLLAIRFIKSGQILDQFNAKITDEMILSYEKLLTEKNQTIVSNPSDPRFSSFYSNILEEAEKMKAKGEVESAINLLNSTPSPKNFVPPPPAGLTGIVLEAETGKPLPGASVAAGGVTVSSNLDGTFNIGSVSSPTSLKITLDGYYPVTINITEFSPFQFYMVTLQKQTIPPPNIAGVILDAETNRPLAKVTVTVGDISVTTNADGRFEISAPTLPTALNASLEGYLPATIDISAQNPYQYFSITLVKVPPPPIFLYATVAFAALAGGIIVLWARSRSRTEYTYRNLDEQAKKLDVTLIKLKRVDSSIAEEINEIKNALLKIRKR